MPSPILFCEVPLDQRQLRLEYQWVGLPDSDAPLMVFLHEGLGSVQHWQRWPHDLCTQLGLKGLVYSRYGYGNSTQRPLEEKWGEHYLHQEAQQVLPAFLKQLGINTPIYLFGHSDGGTIALLYATMPDTLAQAIIVLAPHINVEPDSITALQQTIKWYEQGDLKTRLARFHANPDSAFWGWARVWSDKNIITRWNIEKEIGAIRCPILAIQGTEDDYATLAQIEGIKQRVPHTKLLALPFCRHSPHIEMPEEVTAATQQFLIDN